MRFENDIQANTYKNVKIYLDELFDEDLYHDDETGHFYVSYGSTVIEISVDDQIRRVREALTAHAA